MEPAAEETLRHEIASMRASSRRRLAAGLGLTLVSLVAYPVWQANGDHVRSFVRGEIDTDGQPRYEPPHAPPPEALASIDFARVHERLIPQWTVALGHATSPYWKRRADLAFEELRTEVAPDPNLAELLSSTHRALREDPLERARRLDYWLWAYNHYLDEQGIPWRLEASLAVGEERAIFRTLSYEVMTDTRTPEGYRLRLVRRADRTNTLEGWLGRTGRAEDGALVLMRRVLHFTVRHVWPALHPALDERRPARERSWLAEVRREVRQSLDEETYALLSETAVDQQALLEVAESVAAREACGSEFRLDGLPYNGISERGMYALQMALLRGRTRPECPDITLDEAARLVGASERLETTDGLESAVEALTMVVARSVAAHELRHVADGEELACPGCPDGLDGLAREEVSAYLAAFSTRGLGYLALLQACASPRADTIQSAALEAVLDAVLPLGCEGPPIFGLYAWSASIETQLFGKRGEITLPPLPSRVALLPRPARAERTPEPPRAWPLEDGWGLRLRPPNDAQSVSGTRAVP